VCAWPGRKRARPVASIRRRAPTGSTATARRASRYGMQC
jgi:hypothetical protein